MAKIVVREKVKIHTESFGNSDDTPVLLIAGAMAPAIFWNNHFCRVLSSKGYHAIRFDNRDMGRSTHFPQSEPDSGVKLPYSIDDMVEDANAVLESYSKKKAHIIGHSLGGSIAQLFAVSRPEKTLSVTALSSPILAKGKLQYTETDLATTTKLWETLMSNPMHRDYERGAPEFLKVWNYLNGDWNLDEAMANRYTKAIYDTEAIGPAWNHANVQTGIRDIMEELEKLTMPILFIHGEKDYLPSNPANTKILAGHLSNASAFILKDAGHMFFNKRIWDILIDQIYKHIEKRPNSRTG